MCCWLVRVASGWGRWLEEADSGIAPHCLLDCYHSLQGCVQQPKKSEPAWLVCPTAAAAVCVLQPAVSNGSLCETTALIHHVSPATLPARLRLSRGPQPAGRWAAAHIISTQPLQLAPAANGGDWAGALTRSSPRSQHCGRWHRWRSLMAQMTAGPV